MTASRSRLLISGGSGFIGSTLTQKALDLGHDVRVLDVVRPQVEAHRGLWLEGDVASARSVTDAFADFRPQAIVHLAARADTWSDKVSDYSVNCDGTRLMLQSAIEYGASRFLHTSTQHVYTQGRVPTSDVDFAPFTAYGASKVESERIVRLEGSQLAWTIVRPTNIWGPRHPRYPLWPALARGVYLHPREVAAQRAYGYVENTASQMLGLLDLPVEDVAMQVLYLGDPPLNLEEWVDSFSIALRGSPARRAPLWVLQVIARFGDAAARLGVRAPLTGARLTNMIEDHVVPLDRTFALLGLPPIDMEEGVRRTVAWLREVNPELYSAGRR